MSEILTEVSDGIGWLIFHAPEKMNSLNQAMWEALPKAISDLEADENVRVIVLRGAGDKAFSAGADISEFDTARAGERAQHYNKLNSLAFEAIGMARKPTIAMVHGFCLGGGFLLALSADLLVVSDAASFSLPPAKLGLGFDAHWTALVTRRFPPHFVKEMFFTANRYSADELRHYGGVNKVIEGAALETETVDLARLIASNAPLTIETITVGINALTQDEYHVDFKFLDELVETCTHSEDYKEGRLAFKERRQPNFKGR